MRYLRDCSLAWKTLCTAQPTSIHPKTHQNTLASTMPPAKSNPSAALSLETVGEHSQNHAGEQPQLHNLDYFRTVDGSMPWSWLVPIPFKGEISCIRIKTLSRAVNSNVKLKGGN